MADNTPPCPICHHRHLTCVCLECCGGLCHSAARKLTVTDNTPSENANHCELESTAWMDCALRECRHTCRFGCEYPRAHVAERDTDVEPYHGKTSGQS